MSCIMQCNAFGRPPERQCNSLEAEEKWRTLSGLLALPGEVALSQRRMWTACETTWLRV